MRAGLYPSLITNGNDQLILAENDQSDKVFSKLWQIYPAAGSLDEFLNPKDESVHDSPEEILLYLQTLYCPQRPSYRTNMTTYRKVPRALKFVRDFELQQSDGDFSGLTAISKIIEKRTDEAKALAASYNGALGDWFLSDDSDDFNEVEQGDIFDQ